MPPPSVRLRVGVWVVAALTLGALLIVSTAAEGPLDDADLAMQRAGMLDEVGPRSLAPSVAPDVPRAGQAAVVFFVRPAQLAALLAALTSPTGGRLSATCALAVVTSSPSQLRAPIPVVADETGSIADGYRMRRPRDGGPPVGFAVVGGDGTVRYRTEDPGIASRIDEALIMVQAIP